MSSNDPKIKPWFLLSTERLSHRSLLVAGIAFAGFSLLFMLFFSPHYQLYHRLWGGCSADFPPFGGDFLSEWVGGHIVRAGDLTRLYDTKYAIQVQHDEKLLGFSWGKNSYLRLFYPPYYYLLVSPLSRLSVSNAAVVWCLLMWGCLFLAVWALSRLDVVCRQLTGLWLLLSMLSNPLSESLNSGQKGSLWLLILTACLVLLSRGRTFAAGVVFGLMAFKPPLCLVIGAVLLLKKQWWFVAGCLATGAVLAGLSLWLGWDVCEQYLRLTGDAAAFTLNKNYPLHKEHSWYGFFAAFFRPMQWWTVIRLSAAGMTVLTALILFRILREPMDYSSPRFLLVFAALVLGTILISPKMQTYDLSMLILPEALMLRLALAPPPEWEKWQKMLAGGAVVLWGVSNFSDQFAKWGVIQLSLPTMLGILILLAVILTHTREPPITTGVQNPDPAV